MVYPSTPTAAARVLYYDLYWAGYQCIVYNIYFMRLLATQLTKIIITNSHIFINPISPLRYVNIDGNSLCKSFIMTSNEHHCQITGNCTAWSSVFWGIKENKKAPRHWLVRGIHWWFRSQRASNTENVSIMNAYSLSTQTASNAENGSIWWRHHAVWFYQSPLTILNIQDYYLNACT